MSNLSVIMALLLLAVAAFGNGEDATEPESDPRMSQQESEVADDEAKPEDFESTVNEYVNEANDFDGAGAGATADSENKFGSDEPANSYIPTLTLKSGNKMPMFGLGTYRLGRGTYRITKEALEVGYRLIDTAKSYQAGDYKSSEKEIGLAIKNSEVPRQEIFIITKIMPNYFSMKSMREGLAESLADLQTDYIDLLLMHYPDCGADPGCKATGTFIEGWNNMAKLMDEGLVKDIGISNFFPEEIEKLWVEGDKRISVFQSWMDPYFQERQTRSLTSFKGIAFQAYSLLGAGWLDDGMRKNPILHDKVILELASKYKASAAQVTIKWAMTRRVAVIPGTTNSSRLWENYNSWNLQIEEEDLKKIDTLDGRLKPLIDYGGPTGKTGIFGLIENVANKFKSFFGMGGTSGGEL